MSSHTDSFSRSTMVIISAMLLTGGTVGGCFMVPALPICGAFVGIVFAAAIVAALVIIND